MIVFLPFIDIEIKLTAGIIASGMILFFVGTLQEAFCAFVINKMFAVSASLYILDEKMALCFFNKSFHIIGDCHCIIESVFLGFH